MKKPKTSASPHEKKEKSVGKKQPVNKPVDSASLADGGFMLTTSEILDFSEGTDSTP